MVIRVNVGFEEVHKRRKVAKTVEEHTSGRSDNLSLKAVQLLQFIAWVSYLVFGFALLEVVAFTIYRDPAQVITAVVLLGYGFVLLLARSLLLSGRLDLAVYALCFGHLFATLLVVPARPDLVPVLALTPFMTVGIALPYVSKKVLRILVIAAWLVSITVVAYGSFASANIGEVWYENSFQVAAFAATAAVVLLLLWQFRTRLFGTLSQVRAAEERYMLAERGTNDGLWDWDLVEDSLYLSPRWKEMVGCSEQQIGTDNKEWFNRIHPDDRSDFEAQIRTSLESTDDSFEGEHRIRRNDGGYSWVLNRGLIVRSKTGRAVRMVGAQTDITSRKQIENQLLYQAKHDALTGLLNRASLEERLSLALDRSTHDAGYLFAVLFLDLDRFKNVNDSLGHTLGDHLLIATAERLKACARSVDTIARLGGDEFAVLLNGIEDADEALWFAHRIQAAIAKPFELNGHELFSTASIGVVHQPSEYRRPEDLLRDADIAMYKAKDLGRARHEVFEVAMHSKIVSRLNLETDLRRAINKKEFFVYYQPIVSLSTGRIVAFEALVRWQHPKRGMVSPAEFIPLAEETGLIVPIGLLVMEEACRQMRVWQERFPDHLPLTVDVNLSRVQLAQADLVDHLSNVLYKTGLDGRRLRLEITESTIAQNEELATQTLSYMRDMNVHANIDDFGTGYSSLGTLHRFPVQGLKIDRSFISRIGSTGDDVEIVRTITSLAHNLAMDVVAEGVETPVQLARLRTMGCDYAQGYFFSKPVDGEAATQLLAASPQW